MRLLHGKSLCRNGTPEPKVNCVTFSVVPRLTALWAVFIERAIFSRPLEVFIGDCSGGYRPLTSTPLIRVFPLFNYTHGTKLDLFLRKVCRAPYVVINDDDVFWLDETPWEWALAQFEKDPSVAVVSLVPRERVTGVLKGKVDQPMGSHCLVLRRKIWLKEALSFKIVNPQPDEDFGWIYDTADYANVELIRRGYKVIIAPPEVRAHLVAFDGTSAWALKIQENSGKILKNLAGIGVRHEKAFRTILVTRGLSDVLATYYPEKGGSQLCPSQLLAEAERTCQGLLSQQGMCEIGREVESQLSLIRGWLESYAS